MTYFAGVTGLSADKILDFSANINPLGLPQWLRSVVSSALGTVIHYPDPDCTKLVEAVAGRYGVEKNQIVTGNGTTEIIHLIPRAVRLGRAVIPVPSYADYASSSAISGLEVKTVPLEETEGFALNPWRLESELRGNELVFLGLPNNPTGLLFDTKALRGVASRHPSTLFVVDEAFGDFVQGFESLTENRPCNVMVLLSLTKIYAIPGLRLGCAVADASIVEAIRRLQPCWSVNTIAQAVGEAALKDTHYVGVSREFVREQRECLTAELEAMGGLTVYPGVANFLLVRIDRQDLAAPELAQRMLRDGMAIRVCENFTGLDRRFFRVAVKTAEENRRLCESLKRLLRIGRSATRKTRKPALMFQGTSSNAGKSVLTAALARILLQDGYRVAPFKAQNMSLNSFVTRTGGEMGRAQVVQAQACRLDPDVRMNPILLKPNSDTGSQVIVMGKPVRNMDVMEYVRYKPTAFQAVREAYDSLAAEYDVIVLEGAGSPGEVNLKHHDIVNMPMARYAGASVLLVGDIDRGGVFASFVGTMEVLEEWERSLIAGFVVNRFRGKKELLHDAMDFTMRHTGRPVVGVVQYFHNLGLPEEDSVSFKQDQFDRRSVQDDCVEIAVVDLPHISNFTDFDAFRIEPDVRLVKARRAEDLDRPDAVIIPGSKNVIGDLEYLRSNGMDRRIRQLMENGWTELVGICGGFQMIGSEIADPYGLESDGKTLKGLGLMNLTTVLARDKTLKLVNARHLESALTVRGYEIHHGKTECLGLKSLFDEDEAQELGAGSPDLPIWGTYLHGVFDADEFRRWFIDRLRTSRGLPPKGVVCARYDLEPAFDRLADAVRQSLDMSFI
ncbi:MAG: cobyric acid synthase, partial [Deltaproteobacteria bacterium]|nr:cobyric acid synthase [Deltaproteobacteria bacterium]